MNADSCLTLNKHPCIWLYHQRINKSVSEGYHLEPSSDSTKKTVSPSPLPHTEGVPWVKCSRCKIEKPAYRIKKGWCGTCRHLGANRTEQNRRYAERHPEKVKARNVVTHPIRDGKLPRAKDVVCIDCLLPAQRWDHHKGYAKENWLNVQPVCRFCCAKREKARA